MSRPVYTSSPDIDNALVDSAHWSDMQWVHDQFAWLRQHDPLRRMEPTDLIPGASRNTITLKRLAAMMIPQRPITSLEPIMLREALQAMSGRENVIRSLVQMDEPDHMKYRVLTQAWFSRSNLKNIEIEVARLATDYVDRLVKHKDQCDFVKQVAIPFPLRVIMSILGVPEEDEAFMLKLTQELLGPDDPDNHRNSFDSTELMDVVRDFEQYFDTLAKKRRSNPTDDLATAIANGKINDGPMPDLETYGYYIIVATAGHETTAASDPGALLALIENPDQLEATLGYRR